MGTLIPEDWKIAINEIHKLIHTLEDLEKAPDLQKRVYERFKDYIEHTKLPSYSHKTNDPAFGALEIYKNE